MSPYEKHRQIIDDILTKFDGDMATIIAEVERLLSRYLLTTPMSTTNALKFDIEFDRILTEAGYYSKINQMIDSDYDELFTLMPSTMAAGGLALAYSQDDLSKIMAIKSMMSNNFSVLGSTAGTSLRENLFKYAISNYKVEDMATQLMEDFKGTNLVNHSKTLAITSVSEFNQTMIDIASEGLDLVWVYRGPDDAKTRDFCECILDQNAYFKKEEKEKLKRDSRRRYNCRHIWLSGTEDYVREYMGIKTKGKMSC